MKRRGISHLRFSAERHIGQREHHSIVVGEKRHVLVGPAHRFEVKIFREKRLGFHRIGYSEIDKVNTPKCCGLARGCGVQEAIGDNAVPDCFLLSTFKIIRATSHWILS